MHWRPNLGSRHVELYGKVELRNPHFLSLANIENFYAGICLGLAFKISMQAAHGTRTIPFLDHLSPLAADKMKLIARMSGTPLQAIAAEESLKCRQPHDMGGNIG